MKRAVVLFLALLGAAGLCAADRLEEGFRRPPPGARPHTWWHWMNGNVTREGITADLEAMARVGIGGAQIFNVSEGIPDGPAPFMSPQWLELVRHAAAEADRLGIELCLHNCAGWSSSGGPWIDPEHAMQMLSVSEQSLRGPAPFEGPLPQPETRRGFYRDIALLAFPAPAAGDRVADYRAKALFDGRYGMQPQPVALPDGAAIPRGQVLDLSARLSPDGRLSWDVPAGDWTVLRIGHTTTGAENHPAPEAGHGLECDKLSREALDRHWAGGIAPVLRKLGPLAGKSLNNSLIDSYEVGCNNWTPKFRAEFIRRRGYDPVPFLPAVTGRYIDGSEATERFLWDFRRTIGDLFAENYYDYFAELCHRSGLLASVEPYDGPFECLQVGAKADILMGEFWIGGGEPGSVKLAASVAHTHGIPIVGAESFTAMPDRGRWQNHPGSLKALGDRIWCAGVNRFIFHRYAHQPWLDKFPGMTMGQWGTHFERTNTWWNEAGAWMRYLARAQFLLQQGRSVADVCFFGGEAAPNGGVHRTDLKARGFDYDAFGTDLVPALRVEDGCVVAPSGTRYRVLALADTPWMTPGLARKVRELVQGGATVIARRPEKSPSLSGFPACDQEVRSIAHEVWGAGELAASGERAFGSGRVIWGRAVEDVLAALHVAPDFEVADAGAATAFIHRQADGADVYFVSNQKRAPQTLHGLFRVKDRQPELWDPETGVIVPAPLWQEREGRIAVTLQLDAAGSVFVVFRRPARASSSPYIALAHIPGAAPQAHPAPKLEIRRAEYGVMNYNFDRVVDCTRRLQGRVLDNGLAFTAGNDLAGSDPAPGIVKELRLQFARGARTNNVRVLEHARLEIAPRDPAEAGPLRILKAAYGRFPESMTNLPELAVADITRRLAARVQDGVLDVPVNNELAGGDPVPGTPKQLRVECLLDGREKTVLVREGGHLRVPEGIYASGPPPPQLSLAKRRPRLLAWDSGRYELTSAAGATQTVDVAAVPPAAPLTGPWEVEFHAPVGPQPKATFERLVSWPDHPDPDIRYFSGTAVYRTTFTLPKSDMAHRQPAFLLDLGEVQVIAEVKLNGRELGCLWHAPYRIDITRAARTGRNELEVRVTNLWPNRLIGDERYPADCEWQGPRLKAWPEWMLNGEPRPVRERVTFATWKHWQGDSELLPSGLLGPVTVWGGAWAKLN